jgi:hypothetical protein
MPANNGHVMKQDTEFQFRPMPVTLRQPIKLPMTAISVQYRSEFGG